MAGQVPNWAAQLGYTARGVRGPAPGPGGMSPAQMGGGAQPNAFGAQQGAQPQVWRAQGAPVPTGPPPPTITPVGSGNHINPFGQFTSGSPYYHGGFTDAGQPQRWGYQPPGSPGYTDPNARVVPDPQMAGNTFNWFNQNPTTGQWDRAPVGYQSQWQPSGIPLDSQGNPKWTPDPRSNPGYFVPDNMKFGDTSANAELNHVKQVNDYWNSVGGGDPTQAAARQRYMNQLQGQIDRGGGAQDFQQGRAGYLKDKIDQLTKLAGSKGGTGKMAQGELQRAQSELASIQANRQGGSNSQAQDQGQGTWSEQNAQPTTQELNKAFAGFQKSTTPTTPPSMTDWQRDGQAYAGGNPNFQMGAGPGGNPRPAASPEQQAWAQKENQWMQGFQQWRAQQPPMPGPPPGVMTGDMGMQQLQQQMAQYQQSQQGGNQMNPWAMGQSGFPQDVSNQQMGWGGNQPGPPPPMPNSPFAGMGPQQFGQTMGGMFPGAMPQQGGGGAGYGNLTPQQFNFLSNIPYPSPDGKGGFFNNGTDYGAISNQMAQMGMSPGMSPALRQMGMGGSNMDAGNLAALNAGLDPRDVFSASGWYGNQAGGPFGPQAQAQWGWG